jgi:hypothetical protein
MKQNNISLHITTTVTDVLLVVRFVTFKAVEIQYDSESLDSYIIFDSEGYVQSLIQKPTIKKLIQITETYV